MARNLVLVFGTSAAVLAAVLLVSCGAVAQIVPEPSGGGVSAMSGGVVALPDGGAEFENIVKSTLAAAGKTRSAS